MSYRGLPEQKRLLDAIAAGESAYGGGPGYDVMYGGGRISGFADHPRQYIPIASGPNAGRKSSAAGRYQFLANTWDENARELGLTDFSPESQDQAAWHLANKTYQRKTGRDLLGDLQAGRTQDVAPALAGVWTSIPGGIEPNKATGGFNSRLQDQQGQPPMRMAFAPQQPQTPDALGQYVRQPMRPALSAQSLAGPGAFFNGLIPEDIGDAGTRIQNAGAALMAINNPASLSLIASNNKLAADRALAKAKTGRWETVSDAQGRPIYQQHSITGERKDVPGAQTAAQRENETKQTEAQSSMRGTLSEIGKSYLKLDQMGASVNPDRGMLPNLGAAARSSSVGQMVGQAIGTEDASVRANIVAQRPLILANIAAATGVSAQQLNSNVEFNAYLKAATDPTADTYANLRSLAALYQKFGKRDPSELFDEIGVPQEMRERIGIGGNSREAPQMPTGVRSIRQIN
jgi:muramidase (phage lysozyme)